MSAQPNQHDDQTAYDARLESLIAETVKLAKDVSKHEFLDGGFERAQSLYAIALQMKAQRRTCVTERLEAARMARVVAA